MRTFLVLCLAAAVVGCATTLEPREYRSTYIANSGDMGSAARRLADHATQQAAEGWTLIDVEIEPDHESDGYGGVIGVFVRSKPATDSK